jgi:uncharacterized membrane protein YfcA
MTLDPLVVAACSAAFLAGLVDAVAGGGGLIQLPALLVLWPKTDVPVLLGTNKVASVAGTSLALLRYVRHGVAIPWPRVGPAAVAAFAGSFAGARLAALLPSTWMRPLVVVLLAGVLAFTLARKDFGASAAHRSAPLWAAVLLGAGLGAYDGFFGPGTGSFLLFAFIGMLGLDFLGASASSKVVNVATNAAAILAFATAGQVRWGLAVPMAACNMLGSRIGSHLALTRGAPFVRKLFLVVVSGLLLKLTVDALR